MAGAYKQSIVLRTTHKLQGLVPGKISSSKLTSSMEKAMVVNIICELKFISGLKDIFWKLVQCEAGFPTEMLQASCLCFRRGRLFLLRWSRSQDSGVSQTGGRTVQASFEYRSQGLLGCWCCRLVSTTGSYIGWVWNALWMCGTSDCFCQM